MRPMRPEGGGKPPQANKPIAAATAAENYADKAKHDKHDKRRNLILLGILCACLVALAVWLTALAVQGMLQL